jgi:integrase
MWRRKDGRWTAACYVPKPGGGEVRRYVYGATPEEVEDKLVELRRHAKSALPVAPAGLTVAAYLAEWAAQVMAPRVRPTTARTYRGVIAKYIVPRLGRKRLGQLNARDVRKFLADMATDGVGARTIQYAHATLRAALEDAMREELLGRNVAKLVRAPRPKHVEREPLTVPQVRTLLNSVREHRLYALFVVLAVLGMRRSEALGLRWEDVDLENGTARIRRSLQRVDGSLVVMPTKTERSTRVVPLPTLVVEALRSFRETQEEERAALGGRWPDLGYVFTTPIGTPIDPRNCTRLIQDQCVAAALPRIRLHDLRHGCVSVLLALGVPPRTVMEIVGHTTLEMTMNVYGHVTLDAKRDAMERFGELLDGPEDEAKDQPQNKDEEGSV